MQARRYDEALSETLPRLHSFPHDPTLLRLLADIYRDRREYEKASEYLEQSFRYSGDEPSATQVHDAFRNGGYKAIVRWHLERLLKGSSNGYISPVDLALDYVQLGDQEQAITLLSKALNQQAPGLLWIRCEPAFDILDQDVRYQRILNALPR